MKTLKLTTIALVALSLTAISSFAGSGNSPVTSELNADQATCSSKQSGNRFYNQVTDSFTRHCNQK